MLKLNEKIYFISLSLFLSLVIPLFASAQPTIVFEKEDHDFGDVMQGEDVEYVFVFENIGDEELIIEKVSSS